MASSLSSSLHINAFATAKKECRAGNCEVSLRNVTNVNVNGNSSTRGIRGRQEIVPAREERQPHRRRRLGSVRVQAAAGEEGLKQSDKWGGACVSWDSIVASGCGYWQIGSTSFPGTIS
jgi:hypothetical protein